MFPSFSTYLKEIAASHGELKVDLLSFRGSVTTSGTLGDSTVDVTQLPLQDGYDYFILRLMLGVTAPGSNSTDLDQISFNLKVNNQTLFSSDVEVAAVYGAGLASPGIIDFAPGGYALAGGRNLDFTFGRRAATINTARVLTLMVVALLVPSGYDLAPSLGG